MNKIMTIGGATYDIFLYENISSIQQYVDKSDVPFLLIPQGRKIEFARVHYATGGGATNAAVAMHRLGAQVTAFFCIGDDSQGQFIMRELTTQGINVSHAVQLSGKNTGTSIIVSGKTKENSLLVCHGASNEMSADHIPWDTLAQHEYVYIAPLPVASLLPPIVQYARKKKDTYIAINPGTTQLHVAPEYLYESLPDITCLIVNTSEAAQLFEWLITHKKIQIPQATTSLTHDEKTLPRLFHSFGPQENKYVISQFMSVIHALGPRIVVVTDGAYGVYVGNREAIIFHESIKVEVCSTVGAGDAFSGTFIASIAQGLSLEQAIIRGVYNSSAVVQAPDAKTGLLPAQQLDAGILQGKMDRLHYFNY